MALPPSARRLGVLLCIPTILVAQEPPRQVTAERVAPATIHLDGRLDEAAWSTAQPAAGFVQREPVEGAPATEATEVRFVLEGDLLVIGARMHSTHPESIRPLVGRRDGSLPTEELLVSLDTRRDRVTAYTLTVTPSGTRGDAFHPSDNLGSQDESWDPVWSVHTAIDSAGWTAELAIPLTQLRFDAGPDQSWGVNLIRTVPSRNETDYWVLVGRSQNGWSSRMGELAGLGALHAPARLEVIPYVAMEATRFGMVDPADPFAARTAGTARGGVDLKLGLGAALTLDATINPDFGQVEADPAVVNLSAFETFFEERRPFFIEGNNLFGGRSTFYSRRIGAAPVGSADAPYAESSGNSTILGAAKLTGRLPSGLSIGALTALTAEERVRTFDPDLGFGRAVVAPRTAYGIFTAQQEIGRDRSTAKVSVTAVERDLDPASPLAALLVRRAYSGLLDGRWRWDGGRYDVSAYLVGSYIEGDPAAITRQQRASRRYMQRPDAAYLHYDPTRTSMAGLAAGINHSKNAGNWLWDFDYQYSSPESELNDLGFQNQADFHWAQANFRYHQTRPGLFHEWTLGTRETAAWTSDGLRTFSEAKLFGDVTFRNFWELGVELEYSPAEPSVQLTRGGPLMLAPQEWRLDVGAETRSSERTMVEASFSGSRDELRGYEAEFGLGVRFRPGTRWQFRVEPSISRSVNTLQYVGTRSGGSPATFGGRYLFGTVSRSEVAAQFRASVALTPGLTLEGYFEPFASSGEYRDFGELAAAGTNTLRRYGSDGTTLEQVDGVYSVRDGDDAFAFADPSFNVRSFRSNVVLRWEWRPGSTAYLVWQQDRFEDRDRIDRVGPGGLFQALGAPGDNTVALKISYWWGR